MKINTNFLIIGLGLLGGSIAKKLKSIQNSNIDNIFALSHKNETVILAKNLDLVKYSDISLENVLSNIKPLENIVIIIATPPNLVHETILKIIKNLPIINHKNIIITDISSVKSEIYENIKEIIPQNITFIGSHPMTGKETNGLINSDKNLLDNSITFITPIEDKPYTKNYEKNLNFLCEFWEKLNTKPIIIESDKHDELVALTSHFQHILSAIDINLTSKSKYFDLIPLAIGGSFMSNTRIAKSDPSLWTDIIFKNKKNILPILKQYKNLLEEFEKILTENDREKILKFLENTQKTKIFLDNQTEKI